MPTKTKRDEEKWDKAKGIAEKAGQKDNYAYIMGIYKNMKPDYEFKTEGGKPKAAQMDPAEELALRFMLAEDVVEQEGRAKQATESPAVKAAFAKSAARFAKAMNQLRKKLAQVVPEKDWEVHADKPTFLSGGGAYQDIYVRAKGQHYLSKHPYFKLTVAAPPMSKGSARAEVAKWTFTIPNLKWDSKTGTHPPKLSELWAHFGKLGGESGLRQKMGLPLGDMVSAADLKALVAKYSEMSLTAETSTDLEWSMRDDSFAGMDQPGRQALNYVNAIYGEIESKFPSVRVSMESVDEWVSLHVSLPRGKRAGTWGYLPWEGDGPGDHVWMVLDEVNQEPAVRKLFDDLEALPENPEYGSRARDLWAWVGTVFLTSEALHGLPREVVQKALDVVQGLPDEPSYAQFVQDWSNPQEFPLAYEATEAELERALRSRKKKIQLYRNLKDEQTGRYKQAQQIKLGKYEGINFKPPESVANQAAKGLEYRQKASPSNKGGLTTEEAGKQGIGSGVQRASDLKSREAVSPEVINKMVAFFARHEKNKGVSAEHKGEPWNDKGHVAWLLWGGDAGKAWAEKVKRQMDKADEKAKAANYSMEPRFSMKPGYPVGSWRDIIPMAESALVNPNGRIFRQHVYHLTGKPHVRNLDGDDLQEVAEWLRERYRRGDRPMLQASLLKHTFTATDLAGRGKTANSNAKVVEVPNTFHPVKLEEPKATRKEYPFEGYIDFQGIKIDVENAKGSTRSGTGPEGDWSTYMHAHYGEIRGTEGTDGDKLDVYVGDNHDSSLAVVIHQYSPWDGKYDEDKVVLGCESVEEAIGLFKKQYDRPGFYREGEHTAMPIGAFWRWVNDTRNKGKRVKMGSVKQARQMWASVRARYAGDIEEQAAQQLSTLLAILRAGQWNHQTSHWQVSGDTAYGDHLLFQRLYEGMGAEIDTLAEKIVGLYGGNPVMATDQAKALSFVLRQWGGDTAFSRGLLVEKTIQRALKDCREALEALGQLTLGLDDFLAATASTHETHLYLLQQRQGGVKVARAVEGRRRGREVQARLMLREAAENPAGFFATRSGRR